MKLCATAVFGGILSFLAAIPGARAADDAKRPEEIIALAKTVYPGDMCSWDVLDDGTAEIETHDIVFRYDFETADTPEHLVRLYEVPCIYGTYNSVSVWFRETEDEGIRPQYFAVPVLNIVYSDDQETEVDHIDILGFETRPSLVNAEFDADNTTLTSFEKLTAVGDQSTSGTWSFRDGRFMLTRYEVDAGPDENVDPVTVYDANVH